MVSDGVKSYEYDSEGRLARVTSGGGASYWYDVEGRRIKKEEGGKIRHYIWEGSNVIAEYQYRKVYMVDSERIGREGEVLPRR